MQVSPSGAAGWTPRPAPPVLAEFHLHRRSLVAPGLWIVGSSAWGVLVLLGVVAFDYRAIGVVLAALVRVVQVLTTTVTVTADQVRSRWGWIWLSDKSIPTHRVQDVEIERSIIARVLGLTQVEINSAGGAGSIKLSYLDLPDAERLKGVLTGLGLSSHAADAATAPGSFGSTWQEGPAGVPGSPMTLHRVSNGEILRTQYGSALALTSIALASIIVGVAVAPIALLGVIGAVIAFAMGAVPVWLNYGPADASLAGGLLRIRQGLLTLRTTNTPQRRLQVLKSRQGPVFQLFGFEKVEYASADAAIDKGQRIRQVLAPAGDQGTLIRLASTLLGVDVPDEQATRAFGAVARRATIAAAVWRASVLVAIVGAGALTAASIVVTVDATHDRAAWGFAIAVVVTAVVIAVGLVMCSVAVGVVRARRSRYGFGPDCLLVTDGFVWLQTKVVPLSKVQAVEVTASLAQRLVGAATVSMDVAGVSGRWAVRLADIDRDAAFAVLDHVVGAACRAALPDGV